MTVALVNLALCLQMLSIPVPVSPWVLVVQSGVNSEALIARSLQRGSNDINNLRDKSAGDRD